MSTAIDTIPLLNLSITLMPVAVLILILHQWSLNAVHTLYGMFRMVIQLLLIGYLLTFIFEANNGWIVGAVLIVMVIAASWIALGNVAERRYELLAYALASIAVAGGLTLLLVTRLVLSVDSWQAPQQIIPLAGMIFAASMNSVSLAAERLIAELDRKIDYRQARSIALNAALIPVTNTLFAVGLVSLPGMMTGQILSGVSPFIASRYQMMVMAMLLIATGFSAVIFLIVARPVLARSESEIT